MAFSHPTVQIKWQFTLHALAFRFGGFPDLILHIIWITEFSYNTIKSWSKIIRLYDRSESLHFDITALKLKRCICPGQHGTVGMNLQPFQRPLTHFFIAHFPEVSHWFVHSAN